MTGGAVAHAADVLRRGGLVAFPTETVYGLGADAADPAAVRRVFAAKGRPLGHPLIVHVRSVEHLDRWAADVPTDAHTLAAGCWPGALTLLLRRHPDVDPTVTGGRDTIGLRVPGHPLALELLAAFGGGVAAPSANRFGRVSPTTAADVRADLGDAVDLVLDGGPSTIGVESTILDLTVDPPAVLRPGGVSAETIARLIGRPVAGEDHGPSRAPGMLSSHYAPAATIELVEDPALAAARVAALVAAGTRAELLDPGPDLERYARHLYRWLRDADARGAQTLVVVPPSGGGLALAVRDRLRKAAAPRATARSRRAG